MKTNTPIQFFQKVSIIICIMFCMQIGNVYAQPGGPGGPPGPGDPPVGGTDPGDENPVGVPLDDGAYVLLAIGALLLYQQKKQLFSKKNIE